MYGLNWCKDLTAVQLVKKEFVLLIKHQSTFISPKCFQWFVNIMQCVQEI